MNPLYVFVLIFQINGPTDVALADVGTYVQVFDTAEHCESARAHSESARRMVYPDKPGTFRCLKDKVITF